MGEPGAVGGKETRDRQKSTGETGNSAERKEEAVVRPAHEEDPRASSSPPLPQKTARMKKMVEATREPVVPKDSEVVQRDFEVEPGSTAAAEDAPADDSGD